MATAVLDDSHPPKRNNGQKNINCTKRPICAHFGRFCAIYFAVCAKSSNFAPDFKKGYTLLINIYGFKDCCAGQTSARHP